MRKRGFSQELLRAAALCSMLIDHIGFRFFPRQLVWRYLGRPAFPIFVFLLAEGAGKTNNPGQYALRLVIAGIISELPFDLMIHGSFSWEHQNVMWTLLLGLLAIEAMKNRGRIARYDWILSCLIAAGCAWGAELIKSDYGAFGVLLCVMCWMLKDLPWSWVWYSIVFLIDSFVFMKAHIPGTQIPIECLGVLIFPLFAAYSGERRLRSRWVQWALYLFYPIHQLVIYWIAVY